VAAAQISRCGILWLAGWAALLLLTVARIGLLAAPSYTSEPVPQQKAGATDYALIIGTVWGPDDRPVPGIPIKIRRATDKKPKWELSSDSRGEFAQRVPVGAMDYFIRADIKTPKGQPKPEITVAIENNERKDVSMHLTKQDLGIK
jgi:hypothetical protein